jgi:hypothetical protein
MDMILAAGSAILVGMLLHYYGGKFCNWVGKKFYEYNMNNSRTIQIDIPEYKINRERSEDINADNRQRNIKK